MKLPLERGDAEVVTGSDAGNARRAAAVPLAGQISDVKVAPRPVYDASFPDTGVPRDDALPR